MQPPGFLTVDESGEASFTVVMPIDDVFCPAQGPGSIDTGGSLRVVPSL
jgi:hypothetical protein